MSNEVPTISRLSPADLAGRGTSTAAPLMHVEALPERVGPFRVVEKLGEGGMGVVYLAEQTAPVRRRVALKLIKLGMDTRAVVARFEAERQALALMSHPSVAAVFEAGATEQGRPYFVMEFVPGAPITSFCDEHRLSVDERLALFIQVCLAVQHAHQKGIIHRDIKPTNVLVMRQDGKPLPKVIDFGVAKATHQRLTEQTLYSALGQLIGTPEYMSPEQAGLSPAGVDSRTDVYSLGVLLYELLVGALPFESSKLRAGGFGEIQRIIREVDPPRPSTRFRSLNERAAREISRARRVEPRALKRSLRGDLDSVTMKALEKDPERRYASASELAGDLQRYLRGLPVLSEPPSIVRCAWKFVRRHRAGVAAAAILVVLLSGAIFLAGVLQEAHQELRQREADLLLTQARALHVSGDYQAALRKLSRVVALVPLDADARLLRASGLMGMLRERQAADELQPLTRHANPAVAAEAHRLLARMALFDVAAAQRHLAEARRLQDVEEDGYLRALVSRDPAEAERLLSDVIADEPGHFDALMLRCHWRRQLGDYEGMLNDAHSARTLRPKDPATATNVGAAHLCLGQLAAAEEALREALRLEPTYWYAQDNLAELLWRTSRREEALACLAQAVRDHPNDWEPLAAYSTRLRRMGRWEEALRGFEQLVVIEPNDARWRLAAGWTQQRLKHWAAALAHFEGAVLCDGNLAPSAAAGRAVPKAWHEIAWTSLIAPVGEGRDVAAAERALAELDRLGGGEPGLANTHALLHYRLGAYVRARQLALVESDPNDAAYALILALCESRLGNDADARRLYSAGCAALRQSPEKSGVGSDLLAGECAELLGNEDGTGNEGDHP